MLGSESAREDAGVGRFCTSVAPTTGAELCWGALGSAQQGEGSGSRHLARAKLRRLKGTGPGGCGALSPPGRQGEGERTAGSRTQHAPAKPPIEANP